MFLHIFLLNIILLLLLHLQNEQIYGETISGCTTNNNNRRLNNEKTSVTLSCANNGYILVRNLTFGVHKTSSSTKSPTCTYQPGDCTTRTTFIGMECNGLTTCDLDLNPQYLHICSQYSDYMVLDYSCLQGQSLSVCDNRLISTSLNKQHRLFVRSPNYPYEYENSLNCSCQVDAFKSQIKFLDFYLEERDEINLCSRDYLQMDNRSYCGTTIDDNGTAISSIKFNSSFKITFKTNDVITRKGFWFTIDSEQPIRVICNNLIESTSTATTIVATTKPSATAIHYSVPVSFIPFTESSLISQENNGTHRHTLSYVLIFIVAFVVMLLLLNLILIIICWKQRRRPKANTDSKMNSTNRQLFCSVRSSRSSSSSITYGETPVLTSLDLQKHQTLSTRYIFQPNQQHLDTTPSTSTTTTTTGPYDDLNESMTLQRSLNKDKSSDNQSLYMQHRQALSSPNAAYNRMIHFPPPPIRCQFSTPVQTFYPPQPLFDSQHIYETIQDGHCSYQRLTATLRRQQQLSCKCYTEHNQQVHPTNTYNPINNNNNNNNDHIATVSNPETLV